MQTGDLPIELMLRADLRIPPFANTTFAAQYQAFLDMARWADDLGFDSIGLSEHHGDPAGYCPAPLTVAAAVLARTSRIKVQVAALLVPLHDPVRLAEQIATIDCMAPGRLSVVVGAGYRKFEFEMAGIERGTRGGRVEETLTLWRKAWTGQPFEWRGREMLVTPPPATPGGPKIFLGGKSVAAARRAARFQCDFWPANTDASLREAYFEECRVQGFDGKCEGLGDVRPLRAGFTMVSRDPEDAWRKIADAVIYDAATYAAWQDDSVRSSFFVSDAPDLAAIRASGQFLVQTPEECLALAREKRGLTLHPLMGGIDVDTAWDSLRLFEAEVLPHIRNG